MSKTTRTYWNPLRPDQAKHWQPVSGLEGQVEELTLSIDDLTGEYTRLTRFSPGADTAAFGGKSHRYPEEILVVRGRIYDQAFDLWLEEGHYASRPPGEVHGPFKTDVGCVVLEVSFPQREESLTSTRSCAYLQSPGAASSAAATSSGASAGDSACARGSSGARSSRCAPPAGGAGSATQAFRKAWQPAGDASEIAAVASGEVIGGVGGDVAPVDAGQDFTTQWHHR